MQDNYSLAFATLKQGSGLGGYGVPLDAGIAPGEPLVSPVPKGIATPLSATELALANASLGLNRLAWAASLLRERLEHLGTSLSRLPGVEAGALKADKPSGPETPAQSERPIQIKREAWAESEKRFSKTLDPAVNLLESPLLSVKTFTLDTANDAASHSPFAADAVKTVVDYGKPMVSGLLDGMQDTIKTRVSEKVVDATLGKLPFVGKLFSGDSKAGECCCPTGSSSRRSRSKKTRQNRKTTPKKTSKPTPGKTSKTTHKTARKTSSKTSNTRSGIHRITVQKKGQKPANSPPVKHETARSTGKKGAGLGSLLRGVVDRLSRSLKLPKKGQQAQASTRPLAPDTGRHAGNATRSAGPMNALERGPFPKLSSSLHRFPDPLPGVLKASPGGLTGTLSKVESIGVRRLGPLRYADTAIDVVQGLRNGDTRAVATGLSTAGGAWAGASAGAALGTLVFPGVGTAIGGAIGGLAGSEAGAWLGEKLFGAADRLPAPEAVSKEINGMRSEPVQVTVAPSIQISGINPADARQVVDQVVQVLQTQCVPMFTDSLGIRRNAALTDVGGD